MSYPNLQVVDISDIDKFRDEIQSNALAMDEETFMAMGRSLPARANFVISTSKTIPAMSHGRFYVIDCLSDAFRSTFSSGFEKLFVIGAMELRKLAIAYGASVRQ